MWRIRTRAWIDGVGSLAAAQALRVQKRVSWRVGSRLWLGVTIVHQMLNNLASPLCDTHVDATVLSDALRLSHPVTPRYPQLVGKEEEYDPARSEVSAGRIVVYGNRVIDLPALSAGIEDPSEGWENSPRFHFHTLHWLSLVLDEAVLHQHTAAKTWLVDILTRWLPARLDRETSDWVWDDHITALRAIVLCRIWLRLREVFDDDRGLYTILTMVVRHAERLSFPWVYRCDHNHGVTQAYALMVAGLMFPVWPRSSRWVKIGMRRLEEQMAANVTSEGIHVEHSPFYHCFVLDHFLAAVDMARAYGRTFSSAYMNRLASMVARTRVFVKPDGRLAAFGDTSCASAISDAVRQAIETSEPRHGAGMASSNDGAEEHPGSQVFERSGYAVLRASRAAATPPDTCIVRLSTYPTAHLHRDSLSFEYTMGARELIVDAGGPYEYGHPERAWFLSSLAHNTVVIDGCDHGIGPSAVSHWKDDHAYTSLGLERIEGDAVLRRTFVLLPSWGLCVVDWCSSPVPHRFQQRTHLAPPVQFAPMSLPVAEWSVEDEDLRVTMATRVVVLSSGVEGEPRIGIERGWRCTGNLEKNPVSVVILEAEGTHVGFGFCLLGIRSSRGAKVSTLRWHPAPQGLLLVAESEEQRAMVRFATDGSCTVTVGAPLVSSQQRNGL